ncbi:MAG: hypothetical protein IT204_21670 [Fimbriimonadaceae bacterium]|nr:hypothetical protein [Fimbriimonadaceae bacterium]
MPQYLYRVQPTRLAMLTDGPTAAESDSIRRHFAYLKEHTVAGTVLLAGRSLTVDARTFGIVIYLAPDGAAANDFAANDPAVRDGVMRVEVFPFGIALWSAAGPGGEAVVTG